MFLNQILSYADDENLDAETHWIDRDHEGRPGQVTLGDVPATSKKYDTAERAKEILAVAKQLSGSARDDAIRKGMAALRRTVEELVVKRMFKGVVPRWSDRVIVTKLPQIKWDDTLADDCCAAFEELSAFIEGHSHTDEATGAPPETRNLEEMVGRIEGLIHRARAQR